MRRYARSVLTWIALLLIPGCISYKPLTLEIHDSSGRPCSNAVINIEPRTYVMRAGIRSAIMMTDDRGRAQVEIPDTIHFGLRAWFVADDGSGGWTDCQAPGETAELGDVPFERCEGDLRIAARFIESPAASRSLHSGSKLVSSLDVESDPFCRPPRSPWNVRNIRWSRS